MKRSPIGQRGASQIHLLAAIAALTFGGFAVTRYYLPSFAPRQRVRPVRTDNLANLVRGYIAVAIGRTAKVDSTGGIFSRQIDDKEIFLPGLEVYLKDPKTGKVSKSAKTDLSGRFSLYAPQVGDYSICWKSSVYGEGCTTPYVKAGSSAQFLSTVNIRVPARNGYVAVTGNVTNADGSAARTFEPLLNINAFATVSMNSEQGDRAGVYVNNFGDYLLPYVPSGQKVKLTAAIEAGRFAQDLFPEAQIEKAAIHKINLKIQNSRPHLNPLTALDSVNKRIQNATTGMTVNLTAAARDLDGDKVNFVWVIEGGEGGLSDKTGPQVKWKLPSQPGRYSVTVVAYDQKGGYDKSVYSLLVGAQGIPFSGIVVEPDGRPVKSAEIDIVGNARVTTDDNGRFATSVSESDRYVFNVRKEGYALNSQIYNGSITGGRWILRRGQIVTIDPTRDMVIGHKRSQRDCTGPDSMRAGFAAAGDSLTRPQWQDGKGNEIDPPSARNVPVRSRDGRLIGRVGANYDKDNQLVLMPRTLKIGNCGPGVSVKIPANSILDASGNPAKSPFTATIASVDLLSAQQMPGDESVTAIGGRGGNLKSFGAGSLDLPAGFQLKSGASAQVTIPVDRARLNGGPLPPTVPLLTYDEQRGLWIEEDTLTLTTTGGVRSYVGNVKHFTTFNADTVLVAGAACLRVFSPTLPGAYDLEAITPYPDGTPHYKKYPIDNVSETEHVIYNITPNVNITLAPMTQGANSQLLGFYIVNSGPPESPSSAPNPPTGPPYLTCKNFVVLKTGSAPDSPFGGEFLHGLGYIDAANIGFDDLTAAAPTGNALRDAIVTASRNYNTQVDPNNDRDTFAKFKTLHGFNQNPNVTVSVASPGAGEFVTQYANSGDLGFGRDMHCLKKANGDVACYVTNYGTGYSNISPGGGTNDHDDANAAGQRATVVNAVTGDSKEIATVAMEYSAIENDVAGNKVVKFYVYKKNFPNPGDYGRSISANLDGRGERPVPQLCMICHGGQIPSQAGGVPAFGTADQVKFGSRFIPFDYRLYTFPTTPALPATTQDLAFKNLNEQIVNSAPPASAGDPIRDVVNALYNNGASATQLHNPAVTGWVAGASANAANQDVFYRKVIAPDCRICHASQPFAQLQFNDSDKFLNMTQFNAGTIGGAANRLMLGTAQARVCGDYVMPHALRTHEIFWDIYWDVPSWGAPPSPMRTDFQNFGNGVSPGSTTTWKAGLCTSFISNVASSPSNFYQQSIQPIWNGKCVGCHSGANPPFGLNLSELSPPNLATSSWQQLLTSTVVIPGDDTNSNVVERIISTAGDRMPKNCFRPPNPPNGNLPCLPQADIDKIKAWIRSGAN